MFFLKYNVFPKILNRVLYCEYKQRYDMKKKNTKKILAVIFLSIAAAGLFCFGVWNNMSEVNEVKDVLVMDEKLRNEVVKPVPIPEQPLEETEEPPFTVDIEVDFNALKETNQDIIAWLYLPDTYISFPVLQERTLMEYYYLDHDYSGKHIWSGSIFTPAEPLGVEDAHMLLFGHNSKHDEVMFSNLHDFYSTYEAGTSHSFLYLLYPDRIERWGLWCAVETTSDDPAYEIPYQLGTDSYREFLEGMAERALYTDGDIPSADEKILVLSTCNGAAGGTKRFYTVFTRTGVIEK